MFHLARRQRSVDVFLIVIAAVLVGRTFTAGNTLEFAELAAQGAALLAPEASHWGTRWFVARDPDGNLIAFEQRP